MLVGGILLTHLQNLPCNAHEVAEIEIPAASVKDSAQNEIGLSSWFMFIRSLRTSVFLSFVGGNLGRI
jgi:hypothetical protein